MLHQRYAIPGKLVFTGPSGHVNSARVECSASGHENRPKSLLVSMGSHNPKGN